MKVSIDISHLGPPPVESISPLMDELKRRDPPEFSKHIPDILGISEAAKGLASKKHLIVIGQGGSVTTLKGLKVFASLKGNKAPEMHIIDTVDPSYIGSVLKRAPKKESHVVVVSKGGSTLTVLEALSAFAGYDTTVMVQEGASPLREIAVRKGLKIIDLPKGIGGRFSGGAEGALLPASAVGIDIKRYREGIAEAYKDALERRDVLELCGSLYLKERLGYRNIFVPIYSKGLSGFTDLTSQLFHETLGKERKGLTVLCSEGPECQHHTLQRVLDGPEDVMTLFVVVNGEEGPKVVWAKTLCDVNFRETCLKDLPAYSFGKALSAEYEGLMRSMDELEMPWARMELPELNDEAVGYFVGTMHFIAYYSALMRKVDPFDQSAVERSKQLSYEMRLKG